jgi:ferredoxin-NADP reductase
VGRHRLGRISNWHNLSPKLATFRLAPEPGHRFPAYQPGQYMALRRGDCRLTRRVVGAGGEAQFVPDTDEAGQPKYGPVTHCYSITSAPFETARDSQLEFYVVLEEDEEGREGRLTEALFKGPDDGIGYVDRIVGDFTLAKRTQGFRNVLFVGTGTGVAPFVSMLRHLDHTALLGRKGDCRYTLLYANRTLDELGFHEELRGIEDRRAFDFVYIPSLSRPRPQDLADPHLGTGRANNVLRLLLGLSTKEEEALDTKARSVASGPTGPGALPRSVEPRLPRIQTREGLLARITPAETVILTCGNARLKEDIQNLARIRGFRFEKEDW